MAREASTDEKTLFRTPGSWSRLWLAVYEPNTIYTARLSSVPSSTDMVAQISFTSGSGTLADVKTEMTLWVGSSAGARDLGVCRIRKAPISGTFYVNLTSEVNWAADAYLTVVDLFPLAARAPYMDDGTLKMDTETAYSDQHATFDPVPVLGVHAVAWLTGADVAVTFDAGDSWVFGSSISAYSWSAPGASATSGTSTATPTFTYDAAGFYRVYCTVTAANGKSYTGIRCVFIFDADNLPHKVEITDSPTVSESSGGWEWGVKFHAAAENIVESALAVLFAENWHGATEQSIGPVTNRENILCVGYVAGESIDWDNEAGTVEFTIRGAHEALSRIEINPVALKCAADTPAEWGVMSALTADRAAWHILHWRSNVTALMDFYPSDDTRYSPLFEAQEGTLWDQLNEIGSRIFARGGVDRFGRLFFAVHPNLTPEASRTWATVMTVTEKDYIERVSVERSTRRKMSMLAMSGWLSDAFGTTNIIYSLAMGHIHARHGRGAVRDKYLASGQSQFNTLTGLVMGMENAEFDFSFAFPYLNGLVDVFPNQFLDISLAAGDTPRGIGYAGNLIPRSVTLQYDPESLSITTEVDCDPETFAELSINGDIPPESGVDGWDDSDFPDFDMPGFTDIPYLGEIAVLPPSVENPNYPKKVVIATDQGVFYTENFDESQPFWKAMNTGLTEAEMGEIANLVVTPSGAMYILTDGDDSDGWLKVYRASGLGGTWSLVFENTAYGDSAARITGLGVREDAADSVALLVGTQYVSFGSLDTHKIYTGSGGSFSAGDFVRHKHAKYYSAIVFRMGRWFVFGSRPTGIGGSLASPRVWIYSAGGSLIGSEDGVSWATGSGAGNGSTFADGNGELIVWGNGSDGYSIIHDDDAADIDIITTEIEPNTWFSLAMSPDGSKGMAANGSLTPYKSTDSGATWSSAGGTVPTGLDAVENCGDINRWILAGGTAIKITLDQGATAPENRDGNLTFIAPLVDVSIVRYIA